VCEQEASSALREESSVWNFFRRNKRCYTETEAAVIMARAEIHWSEEEAKQIIHYLAKNGRLKKLKNIFWKSMLITQNNRVTNQS
jgi:hypothetical protein